MIQSLLAIVIITLLFGGMASAQETLPAVARGYMVAPDKGYALEKIGDGLYFVTDGFYTTMFMTTGKGVIVVDAPPTLGEKMLQAVREVTREPIKWVIYSHSHADHVGAAGLYPQDAVYIAHKATRARLQRAHAPRRMAPYGAFVGGKSIPLPTVLFEKTYQLKAGTQTLELAYRGSDHVPGNIFIYAPRQRVLMQVDVVFPGWTPFKGLAIAEDVSGYLKAHDLILAYPFEKMVTGHWNRYASRQDVETQRAYMHDIQHNAMAALKAVDFYGLAGQVGTEHVARLFETYLNEVTQQCAAATLEKWRDRLGGADVWTSSHCYQVIMALRVD